MPLFLKLMSLIAREVKRFESVPHTNLATMGVEVRVAVQHAKADTLSKLAAALKDAAQARIAALDDEERQRQRDSHPLEVRLMMTPSN